MTLHLDKDRFTELIVRAANHYGYLNPAKVEKDYWLTLFLKTLVGAQPAIVFKGSTSLSRCYRVTDRFTEGLDLSFTLPDESGDTDYRAGLVKSVNDVIGQLGLYLDNPDQIGESHDVNQYCIKYPRCFTDKSIKQFVSAKTVVHIKSFPVEEKQMACIIYDYLSASNELEPAGEYALEPFKLQVQSLERTFIDKVFTLADYTLSGNITDHSRHIYDLYMMYPVINFGDDFKALANEVRSIRKGLRGNHSAQDGVDVNAVLASMAADDIFRFDYESAMPPLLHLPIKYSEAVRVIDRIIKSGCFDFRIAKHVTL